MERTRIQNETGLLTPMKSSHQTAIRRAAIHVGGIFTAGFMGVGSMLGGPIFNVIDLGTLGGSSAQASGVNASGTPAGSATTQFGYTHATSSSASGIVDLTLNSTASEGSAAAINGAGTIAGTQFINGEAYASLWSNGAALTIGGAGSYAMAINDAGRTAGMFTTTGGQGHAFVTSGDALAGSSLVDMGTLSGGTWSSAYGINNSGEVAGYGNTASGSFRGFTWTQGGGYSELGTFGGANSYAMAINDSGVAAGSAQTGGGWMNAFITSGSQFIDLGTLGGMSSYAYGINDQGEVVGYSSLSGTGGTDAFLYANGVMIDLNHLIDTPGWVLTQAYAINSSGEIVGAGMLNGVEHAFLLDYTAGYGDASPGQSAQTRSTSTGAVPEPGTLGMFGTGLFALLLRARFAARLRPLHEDRPRALARSRVSPR
jgi:probable HAF family extracellular repeat protein